MDDAREQLCHFDDAPEFAPVAHAAIKMIDHLETLADERLDVLFQHMDHQIVVGGFSAWVCRYCGGVPTLPGAPGEYHHESNCPLMKD